MKLILNFVFTTVLLLSFFTSQSQVQATIIQTGTDSVTVYVQSPTAYDVQIGNITFAFSIPDQTLTGGTNPADSQIIKTIALNNVFSYTTGISNPYIINGRAWYTYNLQSLSSTDVPTNWPANTNNPVMSFTFPTNTYFSSMRLDDLLNFNTAADVTNTMYLYVQLNSGLSDQTNYNATYYGPGAVNSQSGEQYVPLLLMSTTPVHFLNFSATKNANSALLAWQIENESANTSAYNVQRSLDGENFNTIDVIPAKNNGSTANTYNMTDKNLSSVKATGSIFYRIEQIDINGNSVYSPIQHVDVSGPVAVFNVYPNPVKNSTTLTFSLDAAQSVVISLTDLAGKEISKQQFQATNGLNTQSIDMSTLPSGNYVLRLQTATDNKVISIIKIN